MQVTEIDLQTRLESICNNPENTVNTAEASDNTENTADTAEATDDPVHDTTSKSELRML